MFTVYNFPVLIRVFITVFNRDLEWFGNEICIQILEDRADVEKIQLRKSVIDELINGNRL